VNDTTSTPDEPDGRGRVATGEQAAIPPQANGAEGADPAQPDGAAGTSGTNGSAPAQSEEAAAAEQRVDPTGVDAPTAHLEVTPTQVPEAKAAPTPSPTPRPPDPEPAPGPMPGPGPDAAAPPPWHRMSGGDGAAESAPEPPPEETGAGLLDEGPTAFLEGPTAFLEPPARYDEQRAGAAEPAAEGGGWSSVRSVRSRPPRQAALQLKRLDPWSALKLGLVLAVVLFFIWLVAVGVLYGALDGMGVWDRLNGTYADLVSGDTPTGGPLISAGRVFGFAAVIGAINSLLFAVAVTVGAFVYNVSADLVGGIEVTLSERD